MHYSQATVSHHLSRLEAETGAVLTQRVGRGLKLTYDGATLARRGEEIIALLHRAEHELAASLSLAAGRVRLAVFPSAAAALMPGLMNLVVPARGPLAQASTLSELASAPWLAACPQCRTELLDLTGEAGFEPRIRFDTDDYVTVQHLVASGHAVAMLPGLALRAYRHPDITVHLLAASRRQLRALTLGAAPNPPAVDYCLTALGIGYATTSSGVLSTTVGGRS